MTPAPPLAARGRPASRRARVAWPLALMLLAAAAFFASWEVADRVHDHGGHATVQGPNLARGIGFALLAAGAAGWLILRGSPGFLHGPPDQDSGSPAPRPPTDAERLALHARWFIAMRWIAVVLSALLVFLSVQWLHWLPGEVWTPLVATIAVLVGCNALYTILLPSNRARPVLLSVQGYVDLIILTVLLHFSGGIENPLSMMMIFHVIIGGILLSGRQCYGIATAASLLFALLAWGEWAGVVDHYTLQLFPHPVHEGGHAYHPAHNSLYAASGATLQAAVLFLTAYFVTTLSARLRHNEQQIVAMAERVLADRKLLERALETTGAGLRVLGPDLQPYWSSKRWDEWFVCQAGEICPGCDVLQRADSPARQCFQDGRVRMTEIALDQTNSPARLLACGGGGRIFQITTAPLLDAADRITQIVELAQDVTGQKQAQTRLIQASKLAAVGELAGQVAHEVNNPVSVISAKASLLLSDHAEGMSPKVALELGKISELARRVARIAQGLLSYCRPSAASRTRLDVRVPIRKSLAAIDEQARRGGIRIDETLTEPLPPVQANPHELEQVFLNLFLNAIDAMPKGGWLSISTAPGTAVLPDGRPAVAVVVADTGCGIPDDIREKVFEPFFTTKQPGRGTGLGLSICLGLVRSHGGDLEVESKVWQGTRVTIKLPADTPLVKENPRHG